MNNSSSAAAHSSYELGGIILRLRSDVDVASHEYGGRPARIIADEMRSRYYRIGEAEYVFLSLLDGCTTFAAAFGKTAALMKDRALTEQQAAAFCAWLVRTGLASTEQSRSVDRLLEHADQNARQRQQGRWGLMFQRFPLFKPEPFLARLVPCLGGLFSGPVGIAWLALVASGIGAVVLEWDRFVGGASHFIARDNWLWLIAIWILLRIWHELGHALACQRFGGTVRECGVTLILFAPLPYVDISSVWWIASKWRRILTSAGGMLFELPIAALAAIVWSRTEPGLLNQNALNVVYAAGITTLVFNANPLMKFDGYYILSDLLELPNLAAHGSAAVSALLRRWFLGLPSPAPDYPEGKAGVVLLYGIAAVVWRIMVCCGLILVADVMFYGAGFILAAAATIAWGVIPLGKFVLYVARGEGGARPSRLRLAGALAAVVTLSWILVTGTPWFGRVSAVAVVDYYPRSEVRTSVAGFVESIYVASGETVEAGRLIARLRNEDLETEFKRLQLDVARSEQRALAFLARKKTPEWQVEQEALVALRKRETELRDQVAHLTIVAPQAGQVLGDRLQDLTGNFLRVGDLVATIGSSEQKELLVEVSQRDLELFRHSTGQSVSVHVEGAGPRRFHATLLEVAPKAYRQLIHPALGAHNGGPLEVQMATTDASDKSADQTTRYELSAPHFLARVQLPADLQERLALGQTGVVILAAHDRHRGGHLWRHFYDWWDRRQSTTVQQWYRW